MKDFLIKANGSIRELKPMNGRHYTLVECQSYVDGYIETVRLNSIGMIMIINEEGKVYGKLPNVKATEYIRAEGIEDWIAGDVMIINPKHFK